MSRVETRSGSLAVNPSSYERVAAYGLSNPTNAYTDETSTTYAQIRLTRGSAGAVTEVYFGFDTSSIPGNATILSVECKAKVYVSNTANVAARRVQMCSGTTPIGGSVNCTTTARVVTLTGTWTRDELASARILFYGERKTTNLNSDYYFRFYGATLTITYEYQATIYTVTSSSSVPGVTAAPASQECDEGGSASVTISGAAGNIVVQDNGVDVTSQIVQSGSDYLYTITGIAADHAVTVSAAAPAGGTLYTKRNGTWKEVTQAYVKQNGSWTPVKLHYKENGTWVTT